MTTIDDIGRRAARDALADADSLADADAGLARVLADGDSDTRRESRSTGRRWAVLAAAATVAAAVVALVVIAQDDPPEPLAPVEPTVAPEVTPTRPTTPVTTSQPQPPTTAAPSVPIDDGFGVSYLLPPSVLTPQVFATVTVAEPWGIAVLPSGAAVVVDQSAGTATVVAPDGSTRVVALDVVPSYLAAAGPGDVVYGLVFVEPDECCVPDASMVAIALAGDRAGEVVASAPVDPSTYLELPVGAFGLGPMGVTDRSRQVGRPLIGYVDTSGQPSSWPGTLPPEIIIDANNTVRLSSGQSWPLRIERDPAWAAPFDGESPPALGAGGGAVVWTTIGPPVEPGADFSPATTPVLAVLNLDGAATWWQLPHGWSVAASDIGGTILARRDGDQLQLATVTGGVRGDPVAGLADAIGASTLVTGVAGRTTAFADGATTEVVTPPLAHVSSDGSFLWWTEDSSNGADRRTTSTAATLDGTTVCEVDGTIHGVHAGSDGGYLASVEDHANLQASGGESPVPNFAVDCESGERQPVEPRWWVREAGYRYVDRVGDRTFEGRGEVGGIADIVNESGLAIFGDDFASRHAFDEEGSRVVYLVTDGAGATPYLSPYLRARDTTTGVLLWSIELDRPATELWWSGDRIMAAIGNDDGTDQTTAVVVLDATTGAVVSTVPTMLEITHID